MRLGAKRCYFSISQVQLQLSAAPLQADQGLAANGMFPALKDHAAQGSRGQRDVIFQSAKCIYSGLHHLHKLIWVLKHTVCFLR